MINNKSNNYKTNSYKANANKYESEFLNLGNSNNFQMDNNSIIINKSLPLPLNQKKETKNQNNIHNTPQNSKINQINSQPNDVNINENKNSNLSINGNISQNNNNINILQQNTNQEPEIIINNKIISNNNSKVSNKETNNIDIQKNNDKNNNEITTSKNINNNISNKSSNKEPKDSERKINPNPQIKKDSSSKEKFSLKKFIINPNSTLMGKTVPKAMPVYNFINKGNGISETEEQGIVFCAMTIYQEEMKPLSNNTAKYIQSKLGGDWLVMVYPEGKPIDFNMTLVSRNDFMYFTLDRTAYQVCRLR